MTNDNLCGIDQPMTTAAPAREAPDTAEPSGTSAGTPLYDALAASLTDPTLGPPAATDDPTGREPDFTQPAVVLDLFTRLKQIEHSDGSWSAGDTVDVLNQWFGEFGINTDDHDELSAAQALCMPAWLARMLTVPPPHETGLVIHLRTDHADPLDAVRGLLVALVRALGEGSSAAVFDTVGDHIAHLGHSDTVPTSSPAAS
ncbi:hypothetical protein [Umezawaea sp. Da 62-37]|uniref:hypothetical protein n=1 Tax=Umezawaea sp. Da 62-37 TaxID=3075927 RepID=UPI0028F7000E|nr:hypothetical protein [Umezawaea sp. Da 62-37]WNV83125.1 hypothetical protein RM788_33730 [Umezawaea sp. Da 62-37]